jgi:hypothetical protein
MPRWTITHCGAPVATVDAATPEQLGAIAVNPLPAFDALRPSLTSAWRDTVADESETGQTPGSQAGNYDLELWDESGVGVATNRLELVVTGPRTAVAFISLDPTAAPVGAAVQLRPRVAGDTAAET